MNKFFTFIPATREWQKSQFSPREGETKLGEIVSINEPNRKFQLLGVKESIGPQLNYGRQGAENAFDSFISRFLSMQSNRFLKGDEINLSGFIAVKEPMSDFTNEWIEELDELIFNWAIDVFQNNSIPIIIGGGHNNAYPLLKAYQKVNNTALNVVNLDPHADFRALEGRHSGNPFSYAYAEKALNKYAILGLSESYNNEYILSELEKINAKTVFFEEWIDYPSLFNKSLDEFSEYISTDDFGIELDLDSIAFMPTSAFSPSGISVDQARMYIRKFSKKPTVKYLHLPEGAPQSDYEKAIVGKALAFFVSDFIKKYNQSKK